MAVKLKLRYEFSNVLDRRLVPDEVTKVMETAMVEVQVVTKQDIQSIAITMDGHHSGAVRIIVSRACRRPLALYDRALEEVTGAELAAREASVAHVPFVIPSSGEES